MAQPDISQILAALGKHSAATTPWTPPLIDAQAAQQPSAPPQSAHPQHPPPGYPPGVMPQSLPPAPPQSYLPQPLNTGSIDLSAIKPTNSGSVSIQDAIQKARNIAENRGLSSYDSRAAPSREDPRLAGRNQQFSRSRSRSPRRDYGGNPYRDERREDPRRGNFRRTPSPDRGFRGGRDSGPRGGAGGGDGETETIRVRSSLVGLIIGRNGENLRRVESETGARVQFIQAKDTQQQERQCTIAGSLRSRESAKAAIHAIIEENGGTPLPQTEKGSYTAGMPGRAKVNLPALRDGEASSQIMVPDKTVGLIIGRGGETIKDLQERSGCHVNIVGENKSVNGLRPVNLIGSERATAKAKELILEIVESDSRGAVNAMNQVRDRGYDNGGGRSGGGRSGGGGGGGGGGSTGGSDTVEKTIRVPSEAVGMIIGKGGETIKDMQRTSGCKINVNQPKPPDVHRNIDLSGTPRAMEEAERIIWEKVDTVRQRDAAAGRSGQGRDQGGSSQYDAYSQPQQAPPAVPVYGQYLGAAAPQAAPPAYQMPVQQSTQPGTQLPSDQSQGNDAYAAWVAAWYASQLSNQQGAAYGTQ